MTRSRSMPVALVCLALVLIWLSARRKVEEHKPTNAATGKAGVAADETGIHFLGAPEDILLEWDEIASVHAARFKGADGTSYLEIFVDHFTGVDFRFQDAEEGYDQVLAAMEQHLIGFQRARVEAVVPFEKAGDMAEIWKRDEAIQPFRLRPQKVDNREPSPEERLQMESAHKASIATCERILGRALSADELQCISTRFENGRITGGITSPLRDRIVRREAEKFGRPVGK